MQAVEVVKELAALALFGTMLADDAAVASVDRIRPRDREACTGTSCEVDAS